MSLPGSSQCEVVYSQDDPAMPSELRRLLIEMLSHHVENTSNPDYKHLLNKLWCEGMNVIPDDDDRVKVSFARLMMQEVEHGAITRKVLATLGVDKIDRPTSEFAQYFFEMPIETFCDLAYVNALGDRVGMFIGETWGSIPYEPMQRVAPKLYKDEVFHSTFGLQNLKTVCSTSAGLEEANEKIRTWWPTVLDMFGRSSTRQSREYVRWGLRKADNETLRQQYIASTRPRLEELGITVPPDEVGRRFL